MEDTGPLVAAKRGWLLRAVGQWRVAGSFSGTPVALNATANDEIGFSAHADRLGAIRYAPAHAALLTVELDGILSHEPDGYVRARHQRLLAVELVGVCLSCRVPSPAAGSDLHEHHDLLGPGTPSVMGPACDAHRGPQAVPVEQAAEELGVPVIWEDDRRSAWALRRLRSQLRLPPRRCFCAHANAVRATERLFDSLWIYGQPGPDRSVTCGTCGAAWSYDDDPPSLVRDVEGDPRRAHNFHGRTLGARFNR